MFNVVAVSHSPLRKKAGRKIIASSYFGLAAYIAIETVQW